MKISARLPAMQILVSIGTVGAFPQIGEIISPCDFFDCPVLALPLFSIVCPGRTTKPIFTLYDSNDVFPRKDGPFGVERWVTIYMPPKLPQNGHE